MQRPPRANTAISLSQILHRHPVVEGVLYVLPFGLVWTVFLAWPVAEGILMSLFEWKGAGPGRFIGLGNYRQLFADPRFWNALVNTLKFAALVIPLIIGLGLAFALMLWGWGGRHRSAPVAQAFFFFPFMLTISIVALIWKWLMDAQYGLLGYALRSLCIPAPPFLSDPAWALPAIAFVTAWWLAGYRMVVFQAGLEDIPRELFEAARIDGARPRHNFLLIILPLLRPSILFSLVLTILAGFRTFGQVLMMTEGGPGRSSEVLALYLFRTGFEYHEIGKAAASGIVLLLMILAATLAGIKMVGLESELQ